ncbi:MAG: tail fiber domain-containing protein [Bacteroidales bacterium]|nr:tail fiber domain-containing protein [Bacteroidales bacterium]
MKTFKITLITLIIALSYTLTNAQTQGVAINTDGSQADVSAMLDVKSTTRGMLVPRMTELQRNGITSPATGLIIYQTNNSPGFYYHNGFAWVPFSADSDWTVSVNDMYNNNTGNVGIGTMIPGEKLDVAGHIWQTSTGYSVFLGEGAGAADDLSDNINVFIGFNAGNSNSTGYNNVGIGGEALVANISGWDNVAIGGAALWFNSNGHANTSVGVYSSTYNSSGNFNAAFGYGSYKTFNTNFNTALGYNAIGGFDAIQFALGNYTGERLTATGYESLFSNLQGIGNTANGYKSLYNNTSGDYNTAVGHNSGPTAANLSNTGAFGDNAIPTASNRIHIGNNTISWIGGQVNWSIYSDERFKKNINENVAGLDFILKLRPITYQWDIQKLDKYIGVSEESYKSNAMIDAKTAQELRLYTGFLAQEVEQAAQQAGFDFSGVQSPVNDQTPYSISYAEFVVPLVKAIQEQQSIIENLKEKNELMQKQINELKQSINSK